MSDLYGKTALITGSTSGIGYGIALAMAKEGVNVILNGLDNETNIKDKLDAIKAHQSDSVYIKADVTSSADIKQMFEKAQDKLGGVDILVNNAGIQYVCAVDTYPEETWDEIIAVNLTSAFHTIKHALPHMNKAGWGRIINISSVHGLVASPFKSAYVASKHGLIGLTKVVALEQAKNGITCNAICPGSVKTPLLDNQIADTAAARGIPEDEVIDKISLGNHWTKKFVTIDQVAGCAMFLCSSAADNMTGSSLSVDGGWSVS